MFDGRIAEHVVHVNMAHMISLMESGEVSEGVGASCLAFLLRAPRSPSKQGRVSEDIHQQLEQEAVDSLGVEVAGYMNLGKSRNDQVAAAIRMELRRTILALQDSLGELEQSILNLVRVYGRTILPGYTHLQRAQPVTVAHHFFAYFDSIQRDVDRLFELYSRVNLSPMGAAALAGTSVGVDRSRVASLLGFEAPITNALDAVSSRDFVVEAICCAELVMLDLSRLSEELVLWSSYEFGLVELADDYAASSSIMPQKKNPVAAEIVRAKCGSVLGRLVSVSSIIKALPYSYNLDLQETTAHLWSALDDTVGSVTVTSGMLATTKFNLRAISESMKSDYSTATALANYLVKVEGISFRESHAVVGELVKISIEEGVPFEETVVKRMPEVVSRLTKTGKRAKGIERDTLGELLDPGRFLAAIVTPGGSNPSFIPAELADRTEVRRRNRAAVSDLRASLATSENLLREAVVSAAGAARGKKREVKS